MLRLPALVLGISAALAAWLALSSSAVQFDKLGPHAPLIELGFFFETGAMVLGASICSMWPRAGALFLLFGSFGWAVTTGLAVGDNLLVPSIPLALGTLAAILAVPPRRARRRAAAPRARAKDRPVARPGLIEPQFALDPRQPKQWRRLDEPLVRYRKRRRSGWLGVAGTIIIVLVAATTAFAVVMFSDPMPSNHRASATLACDKAASSKAPVVASPLPPILSAEGGATTSGVNLSASLTIGPTVQTASAIYRSGDKAGAFKVWQTQALAGDPKAQFSLGTMYQNGDGVPRDPAKAAEWFGKAAMQGLVGAQTALAASYYLGSGVPQDYVVALRWFQQAAAAGDSFAQFSLGQMYRYGQGTAVDPVSAWAWLEIAAEAGDPNAIKFGSEVYAAMTGAQIEDAKKVVLAWRAAHPKKG